MATDVRPGIVGAAGTLELLLQVLRGEPAAVDYVDCHLHERAEAFEKHKVSGGIFEAPKPSQFASHGAAQMPVKPVFKGPELLPGAREASGLVSKPGDAAASSSERPGHSNVLRGVGTSVAVDHPEPGRRRPQTEGGGGHQDGRRDSKPMGTLSQSRSSGSLQQSGSSIITKPGARPGTTGSQLAPLRPGSSKSRTPYQDMDQAYNTSSSSTAFLPADFDALRLRLSSVIDPKTLGAKERPGTGKPTTAETQMGSTASTTFPPPTRGGQSKEMLLHGTMTPLTARSDMSEFVQGNAYNIVNDIVDTCVELEQAQMTLSRGDPRLGRTALPSNLPSAIWTARAALACAASAEAASAAAEVAAAASAEAAREAAKCACAAKAATGRYNHLVDWVMSSRGGMSGRGGVTDTTMRPGGMAALQNSGADSDLEPRKRDAVKDDDNDDPADGISQEQMENEPTPRTKPLNLPLDSPVFLNEFKLMSSMLDIDEDEAKSMFQAICEQLNKPFDEGLSFPMEEYLDEMKIDTDDREGVERFVDVLQQAKKDLASGSAAATPAPPLGGKAVIRQLFDKVVRHLDLQNIPAKDAWKYVSEKMEASKKDPKVQFLSKAEADVARTFKSKREDFVSKVREYMVQPPTLSASAGQVAAAEICSRQVNEIIKQCKEAGTQYTDPDWDMHSSPNSVLYVDKTEPGYDCTVAPPAKYARLTKIVKKSAAGGTGAAMNSMFGGMGGGAHKPKVELKPIIFKGEIKPGDVVQGQIGTCFLLGAIGAMASHKEKALHKIFIKYDIDVGVYGIRFCVDGEWSHVIVDDWFPVDYNGDLIYAKCKDPQEVWVPILEKAYCKLHTCYEMCDGGEAVEALNVFFGGVSGQLTVKKHHREEPSSYFKLLKNARAKGWLLTTSFVMQPGAKAQGSGKCGEDMLPCGLVGGHVYSVLKLAEANGTQLIQCRNPWGTGEWTGKWSDKNEEGEWTDDMKAATGYENRDDGKFWMSVRDFVMNSGGVDYARTFGPNWKKSTHYAHFAQCAMNGTAKRNWKGKRPGQLSFSKGDQVQIKDIQGELFQGCLKGQSTLGIFPGRMVKFNERPVLRFDIVATPDPGSKDPVTAVVMLMQRNIIMERKFTKRPDDGMNYKDLNYAGMELIIINPQGTVEVRKQNRKRCLWGEVSMPGGGLWRVYALCNSGKGAPAIVRTYLKGGTLTFKEVKGCKFSEVAPFFFDDDD